MTTYTGTAFDDVLISTNTGTTSTGNDTLIGNGGDDVLIGGIGNDVLNDGYNSTNDHGGTDGAAMYGGLGNDTYLVNSVNDTINENPGEGTDTVVTTVSFSLAPFDNVEIIQAKALSGAITLTGNDGDNTLDGSVDTSANSLVGGLGNDTYIIGTGDVVVEAANGGTDTVEASVNINLSTFANVENATLLTATAAISLTGNTGANVLTGNSGNNIIDDGGILVGTGNDVLVGGAGNDTYHVNNVSDIITEGVNGGTDSVQFIDSTAGDTYSLGANVENLTLEGSANLNGTGNAVNNLIIGNAGNNTLDGGTGTDTLQGGLGNDTYIVASAADKITDTGGTDTVIFDGATGTYTLTTGLENLTLGGTSAINGTGTTAANILTGNTNNNVLNDGGVGAADTMIGGTGNDTYVVNNAGDVITELAGEGTDTVDFNSTVAGTTYTLGANIENLVLQGTVALNGTGNAESNTITGNGAANILDDGGVGGNNSLIGGSGNDTYMVHNAGDVITEAAAGGTADLVIFTGTAGQGYNLAINAMNVENLTLGGSLDTNATGNSGNNLITGNAGDNTIIGGGGLDIMKGGAGNDYYVTDSTNDIVVELNAGGTDTVQFNGTGLSGSQTYSLSSYIENLILGTATGDGGSINLNGNGNAQDNIIEGNAGNNVLNGGSGNDTVSYANATAGVTIDLHLTTIQSTGGAGNDTLSNFENILGSTSADTLTGSAGNNTIDGGGGDDSLVGGGGTDTISFASSSVGVNFNLGNTGSQDTGNGHVTQSGFMNVIGSTHDDVIEGGYASSSIYVLTGNGGNDTVSFADATSSIAVNLATTGAQIVTGSTEWTLNGFENVIGSAQDDVITGDASNNVLDGGGSGIDGDVLIGGGGTDTYIVHTALDTVDDTGGVGSTVESSLISLTLGSNYTNVEHAALLGSSNLNLTGDGNDNVLTGNSGNNVITGGAGDDTLDGGSAGADTLIGGAGNDTFVIHTGTEVVTEAVGGGTDTVTSSQVSLDLTNYANVEHATLTGSANLNLTGSAGDDVLTGNLGNNTIDGGGSSVGDTLIGGGGTDTYIVHASGDVIDDTGGVGSTVESSTISLTLSEQYTNVENATLTGTSSLNLTGDANDNVLTGNSGTNFFIGGGGHDTFTGNGGGDDFFITATPGAANTVDITTFDPTQTTGDVLDLHNIISGYTSGPVDNWVEFASDGQGNTQVMVDSAGTGSNYVLVATLHGVTLTGQEDALAATNTLVM